MAIKIFTVEEMVAAEKAADAAGVSYDQMMETAGRSVADAIIERLEVQETLVLILVGPGNNGGDGLVAGRYLALAGADVIFYLYKSRDVLQDRNYALVEQMMLPILPANEDEDFEQLQQLSRSCDLIIDALLGTGVTRPIGGNLAGLMEAVHAGLENRIEQEWNINRLTSTADIELINSENGRPAIIAVDCPSGLNCDSGVLDPLTLEADLTVTFAGPKRGHFMFPGASACGELVVADIDISTSLPPVAAVSLALATAELAADLLPKRGLDGHKGTFGTVLIAAGSHHYWGAPLLAAQGAYRVGAGLVALTVPSTIRPTIAGQLPEATYPPVQDENILSDAAVETIMDMAGSIKSILVGPGLGAAQKFMKKLMAQLVQTSGSDPSRIPLVIDADGLNIIAAWDEWPERLPAQTILTPHPGEMARLMSVDLGDIRGDDRVELARSHAQKWGHIVVLKGAFTIVAAPDGRCSLIPFANPLLAVGGSGDVLAGVTAGLLGQGLAPYEAAVLGAYLHGAAGEMASNEYGEAGMLSSELADWIPDVRQQLLGLD